MTRRVTVTRPIVIRASTIGVQGAAPSSCSGSDLLGPSRSFGSGSLSMGSARAGATSGGCRTRGSVSSRSCNSTHLSALPVWRPGGYGGRGICTACTRAGTATGSYGHGGYGGPDGSTGNAFCGYPSVTGTGEGWTYGTAPGAWSSRTTTRRGNS